MIEPANRHFLGVALIGMSILVLEVVLTRIFSVTVWYYFGFFAVSLALLGLSASGIVVYLFPRITRPERLDSTLGGGALLAALGAVLAISFHLHVPLIGTEVRSLGFLLVALGQVFVLTIPFFFAGLCLALALTHFHARMPRLYFFDLAGSGLGCLLVIFALANLSGPTIAFLAAALAITAALAFQGNPPRKLHVGLLLLCLLAIPLNEIYGLLRVRTVKSYRPGVLQAAEGPVLYEEWSPVNRTSVLAARRTDFHDRPRTLMVPIENDAGASTSIHQYLGSLEAMAYTAATPLDLALHLVPGKVLIIGAGAGVDVWAALATGHPSIVAVELNPVTVKLMRNSVFADFAGRPYSQPGVALHLAEGRSFVAHSEERFDIIELTMVDSWVGSAAGAFMFNENNLYTTEAVRSYWDHLTERGVIAISRYFPFSETLRLTSVAVEALLDEGLDRPGDHLLVTRDAVGGLAGTVMLWKEPLSPAMVQRAAALNAQFRGELVWAPHLPEKRLADTEEDLLVRAVIEPTRFRTTREGFLRTFSLDITPTSDDRPFFFFMQRWRTAFDINPKEHPARSWALPVIYALFLSLLVFSLLFLVGPLLRARRRGGAAQTTPRALLAYFACLGMGYMLVEIPLIQKFVLFLGHPTYSFTVVVASLLISSGIGSHLSSRLPVDRRPQLVVLALAGLLALLGGVVLGINPVLRGLLGLGLPARIALALAILAPLGLLMGVPFPSGIRLLAARTAHAVPWAWAINGVFSVLTTVLALLVAIGAGFQAALALSFVAYATALLCVLALGSQPMAPPAVAPAAGELPPPLDAV